MRKYFFRFICSFSSREAKWSDKLPRHKMILDPKSSRMVHPVYSLKDIQTIEQTHHKPSGFSDYFAFYSIRLCRKLFDLASLYDEKKMDESKYIFRFILLETVAGIPGFVAAMCRHLRSLRILEQDHGWIHHLLEEAENERMHLFVFLQMKKPRILFRFLIILSQGIVFNNFMILYLISPKTAHRVVGYMEEEAVKTYSHCIDNLDKGNLPEWSKMNATSFASDYWNLPKNAKFRDLLLAVRADECVHREVNHHFASLRKDALIENEMIYVNDGERKEENTEEPSKNK